MTQLLSLLVENDLAAFVLSLAVQSTVVMMIALVVAWRLPRHAALRHSVLRIGMLCTLACPLVFLLLHWFDVSTVAICVPSPTAEATPPNGISSEILSTAATPAPASLPDAEYILNNPLPKTSTINSIAAPARPIELHESSAHRQTAKQFNSATPQWLFIAVAFWIVGFALRLVGVARSAVKVRRLVQRATPCSDQRIATNLRECLATIRCRRVPTILISSNVHSPLATGWKHPVILLPRDGYQHLSDADMRAILLHELAHVARGDHISLMVDALFGAIYWPHPITSWLRRGLAQSREEVCDNYVIQSVDRLTYSELLLRLAKLWPQPSVVVGGVGLFSSRWRLESRVSSILDERRRTMLKSNRLTGVSVAAAMVVMILAAGVTRVVAQRESGRDDVKLTENGDDVHRSILVRTDDPKVVGPGVAVVRLAGEQRPTQSSDYSLRLKSGAKIQLSSPIASNPQSRRSRPSGEGHEVPTSGFDPNEGVVLRIAFIDISRVIKESPTFQRQLAELKEAVKHAQDDARGLKKELEALQRAADAISANDSVKAVLLQLIAKKEADRNKTTIPTQQSLIERETRLYHEAYQRIQREISEYADERGIDVVLRDAGQRNEKQTTQNHDTETAPIDRSEILRRINQGVVYLRNPRIDITDAIIDRLRARARR